MAELSFRLLSLLLNRRPVAPPPAMSRLDFSSPANSGYRGFFF